MKSVSLNDWDVFAVAECAAEVLANTRPQSGTGTGCPLLRSSAVMTLRTLWKQGDLETRKLVAQHIHIALRTGRRARFAKATSLGGITQ